MIPKKWREYTWPVRPFVVLGWLIYSPAVVLPLLWLWSLPWESPNAPGWVQAVGSILAVLAAIVIASNQHRVDVARRRQEQAQIDLGLATRLHSFAVEYKGNVCDVLQADDGPRVHEADKHMAEVLKAMLERLNGVLDQDLNVIRQQQISMFRTNLVGLIFLLQNTDVSGQSAAIRSLRVPKYQAAAHRSLAQCSDILIRAALAAGVPRYSEK